MVTCLNALQFKAEPFHHGRCCDFIDRVRSRRLLDQSERASQLISPVTDTLRGVIGQLVVVTRQTDSRCRKRVVGCQGIDVGLGDGIEWSRCAHTPNLSGDQMPLTGTQLLVGEHQGTLGGETDREECELG